MRSHTIIRPLAAALLTVSALAVAACGGEEPAGGATSAADREARTARPCSLTRSACASTGSTCPIRSSTGGGVRQRGPDEDVSPDKLEAAEAACRKHMEDVEPPKLSDEQQQAFKEAALAHGRCMREHGIETSPTRRSARVAGSRCGSARGSGIDPGTRSSRTRRRPARTRCRGGRSRDREAGARRRGGRVAVAAGATAAVLADGGGNAGAARDARPPRPPPPRSSAAT